MADRQQRDQGNHRDESSDDEENNMYVYMPEEPNLEGKERLIPDDEYDNTDSEDEPTTDGEISDAGEDNEQGRDMNDAILEPAEPLSAYQEDRYLRKRAVRFHNLTEAATYNVTLYVQDTITGNRTEYWFSKEDIRNQSVYFDKFFMRNPGVRRVHVKILSASLLYQFEHLISTLPMRRLFFESLPIGMVKQLLEFFHKYHFPFLKRELMNYLNGLRPDYGFLIYMDLGMADDMNRRLDMLSNSRELNYMMENPDLLFNCDKQYLTLNQILRLLMQTGHLRMTKMNRYARKLGNRPEIFQETDRCTVEYWDKKIYGGRNARRDMFHGTGVVDPTRNYDQHSERYDIVLTNCEFANRVLVYRDTWFSKRDLADHFPVIRQTVAGLQPGETCFLGFYTQSTVRLALDVIQEREGRVPPMSFLTIYELAHFARCYEIARVGDFAVSRAKTDLDPEAYVTLCYEFSWIYHKNDVLNRVGTDFDITRFFAYLYWLLGDDKKVMTTRELHWILYRTQRTNKY